MNCPSCSTRLEPNARFCGVCGYRLEVPAASPGPHVIQRAPVAAPSPAAVAARAVPVSPRKPSAPGPGDASDPAFALTTKPVRPPSASEGSNPAYALTAKPQPQPQGLPLGQAKPVAQQQQRAAPPRPKPAPAKGDEMYIGQTLNNRFAIESKIGEGGFGAVYRGTQLATNRKVALKLLHPEMTKDENLVARFRREGMVLCNLRDAHTITTYDFDQTPDGTLYIAMELLEGKSLHHLFHEQAPLEWKRMFKILGEMCSSLAEAHAQGIVHRDLKPENVYLETRPGNPEFVKILDFGIAKVMRGDTIDPSAPQLTATGQTLGTLEYMSPEQLMGRPLDGRSDVYALGVVAYEMITGRLPFPDAKGPAGLITAQLKHTPIPPSQALPAARLPPAADRVILKCLEKDKDNRFADVTALALALAEVVEQSQTAQRERPAVASAAAVLPTRMGDPINLPPPPAMPPGTQLGHGQPHGTNQVPAYADKQNAGTAPSPVPQVGGWQQGPYAPQPIGNTPGPAHPMQMAPYAPPQNTATPLPLHPPQYAQGPHGLAPVAQLPTAQVPPLAAPSSKRWLWWVIGLLVLGISAGAGLAFALR